MKEIWEKNKIYIILAIIVITLLPLIINYTVINNGFESKAGNDGWASFFGSYLGGVIGGIGTLIAVLVTTHQTRKIQEENKSQNKKNMKIQILNEKVKDYKDISILTSNVCNYLLNFDVSSVLINKCNSSEITNKIDTLVSLIIQIEISGMALENSSSRKMLIDAINTIKNVYPLFEKIAKKTFNKNDEKVFNDSIEKSIEEFTLVQNEIYKDAEKIYEEKYSIENN